MKTVGDIARIFSVDKDTVKKWAYEFRDYLSNTANPPKRDVRSFTQNDIMVLALIAAYWEEHPDYENIRASLDSNEQHEDWYVRVAYLNTPLFQEIPDDIDETWRSAVILGGMKRPHQDMSLTIAEAYKIAGDEMVRIAISTDTAYEMAYPILFMYRHAIEVYLKVLLPTKNDTHNLLDLISAFRAKYNTEFAEWAKDRLNEFHKIDSASDTFRYADSKTPLPYIELMVDLRQLRVVIDHICTGLKNKILNSDIPPAYMS